MLCALDNRVAKGADAPRTRAREWKRRAREARTGDGIASVGLFTGEVISRDPHDGRDSVQSSAERARRCCALVGLMRYRESRIRGERRATAAR